MVFRDTETLEMFVFDANGVWNKEAIEHPLLYWSSLLLFKSKIKMKRKFEFDSSEPEGN